MRSSSDRLVVAALAAVLVAATADAFVSASGTGAEPRSPIRGSTPASERHAAEPSLPRCAPHQLRLSIEIFTENPFIALTHAEGAPCHLAAVPVELTVNDRAGKRVRLATTEAEVADDFAPGYVRLLGVTYLPRCGQPPPFIASVEVDGYAARRTLPPVGCIGETS